jgi:hypothetical protein
MDEFSYSAFKWMNDSMIIRFGEIDIKDIIWCDGINTNGRMTMIKF